MERKKRLVVVLVKEKREKPWFWKGKREIGRASCRERV